MSFRAFTLDVDTRGLKRRQQTGGRPLSPSVRAVVVRGQKNKKDDIRAEEIGTGQTREKTRQDRIRQCANKGLRILPAHQHIPSAPFSIDILSSASASFILSLSLSPIRSRNKKHPANSKQQNRPFVQFRKKIEEIIRRALLSHSGTATPPPFGTKPGACRRTLSVRSEGENRTNHGASSIYTYRAGRDSSVVLYLVSSSFPRRHPLSLPVSSYIRLDHVISLPALLILDTSVYVIVFTVCVLLLRLETVVGVLPSTPTPFLSSFWSGRNFSVSVAIDVACSGSWGRRQNLWEKIKVIWHNVRHHRHPPLLPASLDRPLHPLARQFVLLLLPETMAGEAAVQDPRQDLLPNQSIQPPADQGRSRKEPGPRRASQLAAAIRRQGSRRLPSGLRRRLETHA